MEGLLVADKPAGPTSHDIVAAVRRFTRGARVGHTGTLDPFATGVLPLCIGRATRLARFLTASRKVYEGEIRLGLETDTRDIQGRPTAERPVPPIDPARLREAVARLTGPILQTPPVYSARKVGGTPMHRLARQGVALAPAPVPVTIHRFDILEAAGATLRFEVETSAGVYVRSLAHDLGAALGCGGCLASLRRLASGGLRAEDAHGLEEIQRRGRQGALEAILIPLRAIDLGLPTVCLTGEGVTAMRSGRALTTRDLAAFSPDRPAGAVRVTGPDGDLVGVARPARDARGAPVLQPDVVLVA